MSYTGIMLMLIDRIAGEIKEAELREKLKETGGGFSKEESEVMDKIVEAHNLYMKLKATHPSDHNEWITAIHTLQYLLSMRILQREHPEIFATIEK